MHNHSKDNFIILKGRVSDPGLALQQRSACLYQLLRLLLPAQAYGYRREDLHEDANARFN
jgi:hypothetical protein